MVEEKKIGETVKFSDWEKLDIRVGKILGVESVEGADKLYKLKVSLGKELGERTLVAGLKLHYSVEELEGKSCIVFTNLEPREIRGVKSQGMVLAAISDDESKVVLLKPESNEGVEEGSKVR